MDSPKEFSTGTYPYIITNRWHIICQITLLTDVYTLMNITKSPYSNIIIYHDKTKMIYFKPRSKNINGNIPTHLYTIMTMDHIPDFLQNFMINTFLISVIFFIS